MARQLNAKIAEMVPDGLVTDTRPHALVRGGTLDVSALDTGAVVPRGTLLGKKTESDGKLHIWQTGGETAPDSILCDDVTVAEEDKAEGVPVAVYVAGCFDPAKLKTADGEAAVLEESDFDLLRTKGILFKGAVPVETAED